MSMCPYQVLCPQNMRNVGPGEGSSLQDLLRHWAAAGWATDGGAGFCPMPNRCAGDKVYEPALGSHSQHSVFTLISVWGTRTQWLVQLKCML